MRGTNFWHHRWLPVMKRVGLMDGVRPKYHFHALRHNAARFFIEQGLQPKRIQKLMGHATIAMTFDVYGDYFDEGAETHEAVKEIERDLLG